MPLETIPFDAADSLDTPEAVAAFLDAALDEVDAAAIVQAVNVVARTKGMAVAVREGVAADEKRGASATGDGGPRLSTLLAMTAALGMKLRVSAI